MWYGIIYLNRIIIGDKMEKIINIDITTEEDLYEKYDKNTISKSLIDYILGISRFVPPCSVDFAAIIPGIEILRAKSMLSRQL